MAECEIKDSNNKSIGTMKLADSVFGVSAKGGVIHQAVRNFLANQRQGTHDTKTRGLVSGGGKKPWRQKHTGRARSGSNRSPLWRGGGTVFGPHPRDYSFSLPKKARKLALYSALSGKLSDNEIKVVDAITIEKPRTKDMVALLESLGIAGESILVVIPEKNDAVFLSARNIPGVTVRRVTDLNAYEVAAHRVLLLTKRAAEMLSEAGKDEG